MPAVRFLTSLAQALSTMTLYGAGHQLGASAVGAATDGAAGTAGPGTPRPGTPASVEAAGVQPAQLERVPASDAAAHTGQISQTNRTGTSKE